MKKALIINPNGTMFTTDLPDLCGDDIRRLVGNWFDCVRGDDIIGYVDDEGLLNGSDLNLIASIVFGRYLAGVVVVFGCLNENGEYDGENYDITPDALLRFAWCAEAKKTHEREIALRAEI
jgi:hypothetical protein